jgi:5'-methylthioadenosine phosphorylase
LAKEAGMAYATLAMVTDFDCWKEEHCNVEEIMKIMQGNYLNAQKVVQSLIKDYFNKKPDFSPENAIGVMTPPNAIPEQFKPILEVLLR